MTVVKLFTPLTLGGKKDAVHLLHRVVMAPLTRLRTGEEGLQSEHGVTYYTQRATHGGLLIAEATNISPQARGTYGAPGIFTAAQIEAWKNVTGAVHGKGGKIFLQLWHTGRLSHPLNQPNGELPVSSSATPFPEVQYRSALTRLGRQKYITPRALEIDEIPQIVADYRQAAINALEAGFDGVELHAANGYLLEQFLIDGINKRTDKYGGSIENRARLLFEALEAILSAIPSSKVGIRLSPYGVSFGLSDSTPAGTYGYVVKQLNQHDLAYVHIIEPGGYHVLGDNVPSEGITPMFRKLYDGVLITASGFTREKAVNVVADSQADAVAVGRAFISNPDLVKRYELDLPLTESNRDTYYLAERDVQYITEGYTDYVFYEEQEVSH